MAKLEIRAHSSDRVYLELPRVYGDVPTEALRTMANALNELTEAVHQYELSAEQNLLDYETRGMEALSLPNRIRHDKLIAKAAIQVLAELTFRVYMAGDDGRYFINSYSDEVPHIFSGFDTQSVIYLATTWENQLSG